MCTFPYALKDCHFFQCLDSFLPALTHQRTCSCVASLRNSSDGTARAACYVTWITVLASVL